MDFATRKDLDVLTRWGTSFHSKCPYSALSSKSPQAIQKYLAWHLASTTACIIKTDSGMIGGVIQPALDYAQGLVVRESFLWCERPKDGLRLIKGLEDWARQRDVQYLEMSTLCDSLGDRIGNILCQRRGYTPLQKTYRLKIE